jgi:hypothetical protein
MTPCRLVNICWRFGGVFCFNFQGPRNCTLNMKDAPYSEKSVTICQLARRHIPEDEHSATPLREPPPPPSPNSRVFRLCMPSTGWMIQLRRPTFRSMQDKDSRQHSIRATCCEKTFMAGLGYNGNLRDRLKGTGITMSEILGTSRECVKRCCCRQTDSMNEHGLNVYDNLTSDSMQRKCAHGWYSYFVIMVCNWYLWYIYRCFCNSDCVKSNGWVICELFYIVHSVHCRL